MTNLSILRGVGGWLLAYRDDFSQRLSAVDVPFEDLSTRPDPIRRAWAAIEAKRAMNGSQR